MSGISTARRNVRTPLGPFFDEEGREYWKIPLTQGMFALVSGKDVERVAQFNWYASHESRGTKYYAIRWESGPGRKTKIRMHRFVKDQPPKSIDGRVVDHLNDDGLDNRDWNLEVVTQEVNMERCRTWRKKGMKISEPNL